jgi:hypothetical protein
MFRCLLILSMCLTGLAGCGDSGPSRVPVDGTILMSDGKPVFPGSIAFIPTDEQGHQASTLLHDGGKFSMRTYPYGDGVVPGKYKIVLSLGMGSPPELGKYASASSSTLEVTVTEPGTEDLKLTLNESAKQQRQGGPPGMRR